MGKQTWPPADAAEWYRLESFDLGNGGDGEPSDNVGVVTRWTWPDALEGVTMADLQKVQAAIAARRWRENAQSNDWAGYAVADVLKLDIANKAHRAKVATLLKMWISTGMLVVVEGLDTKREKRSFIEVGTPARD
jgi:hypothetical protein